MEHPVSVSTLEIVVSLPLLLLELVQESNMKLSKLCAGYIFNYIADILN